MALSVSYHKKPLNEQPLKKRFHKEKAASRTKVQTGRLFVMIQLNQNTILLWM